MLARMRHRLFVLAGAVALLGAGCSAAAPAPTSVAATDAVFVIPVGTEAALERGEPGFQFPDEISVKPGGCVVITNQDHAMHYFFDIPVAPGQTIRKPFPRSGEFVYQGGPELLDQPLQHHQGPGGLRAMLSLRRCIAPLVGVFAVAATLLSSCAGAQTASNPVLSCAAFEPTINLPADLTFTRSDGSSEQHSSWPAVPSLF